MINTFTGLAN